MNQSARIFGTVPPKNQKLAEDLIRWLHKKENDEEWFPTQEAHSVGATGLGEPRGGGRGALGGARAQEDLRGVAG